MPQQMSQTEVDVFLKAPRHAIVGTNPADGAPHLSPVWYLYENGRFYISVATNTVKHRNLQREPQIAVCVDGCRPDGRTVMVTGLAELVASGEPLQLEMRRRIIRHYHDSEADAEKYIKQAEAHDSVLVVVTPQKILTQNFN